MGIAETNRETRSCSSDTQTAVGSELATVRQSTAGCTSVRREPYANPPSCSTVRELELGLYSPVPGLAVFLDG